jgi:MYXO-CTERM domain-containing protein
MQTRTTLPVAALLALLPALAHADLAPPPADAAPTDCQSAQTNAAPCDGKKAGDACTFANGTAGNCAALRCVTDGGQTLLACVATGAEPSGSASSSKSGCSTSPSGPDPTSTAALVALGVATFLAARRRDRKA